ncbi:hypothetical protein RB199_09170 [Streptomyces libani]
MPITVTATTRRAAVAALLATATLALTAGCHDGVGNKAEDAATAVSPAPTPPSADDGGDPPPGPDGQIACTPEMLRFHAGAMPRRAHRMLLTVTNFSDRPCTFAAQPYPPCCGSATTGRPPSRRSRPANRRPWSPCRPTGPPTP